MFFFLILVDLRAQDPSQDGPKTLPSTPKTPPRRSQDVPRCSQDASRRLQNAPRCPQDTPRLKNTPKSLPKTSPDPLQDWFFSDFGPQLGASWGPKSQQNRSTYILKYIYIYIYNTNNNHNNNNKLYNVYSWLPDHTPVCRSNPRATKVGGGGDSPQAFSIYIRRPGFSRVRACQTCFPNV